jgi:hypothetical protein
VNKSIEDQFNYLDLPRDGQTFFAKDNQESLALFLDMTANATYVLLPSPYMDLLIKWESETNMIQLAPMTADNVAGGFIGTANSVEIFSDVYAIPEFSYVRGAPIIFGQWGGKFSRDLEYTRTPYYTAKKDSAKYCVPQKSEVFDDSLFSGSTSRPEHILIPQRFLPDFYNVVSAVDWELRRGDSSTIEQQFNGHIGWYKGIPVYTDSYMHRRMINDEDLIEVHYQWHMGQPRKD